MNPLPKTIARLRDSGAAAHLANLHRGLEKESLRVGRDGLLAQTPHPHALGAPLTHPSITTDYSEALLEFVTPIHADADALLRDLHDIHHFTYHNLAGEKLWVNSMPCIVRDEEHIPIARYGASNIAKMKEAYRRGLSYRYGGIMQTIAGIHFNFSLPREFWRAFVADAAAASDAALQEQISAHYFALIRNFHRHSWLVCYLFGASPAVCKSFLQGRAHALQDFDASSLHAPFATSLRLSGLGYSSDAQSEIEIDYNGVQTFAASLRRAIQTPRAEYEAIGVKVDGEYRQLNANWLQIENEFYSVIRPKRAVQSGESPSRALQQRGVEYVEVRCVDLNPFLPVGIDAETLRFFDLMMLYCLFAESAAIDRCEWQCAAENRRRVVMEGRRPELQLCLGAPGVANFTAHQIPFASAANELLEAMRPLAALLDEAGGGDEYVATLHAQAAKVAEPSRTPSAQILHLMKTQRSSFYEFATGMATAHETHFKRMPLEGGLRDAMRAAAEESHARRREIEAADSTGFDEFLADYFRRQDGF